MQAQEIFNTVAVHLFTQGHRAGIGIEGESFACQYRAPNGKCAVGVLIPDDKYDPGMDASPGHNCVGWETILKRTGMVEHDDLLTKLQSVHDEPHNWNSTAEMKQALRDVARRKRLDDSILEGLSFPN